MLLTLKRAKISSSGKYLTFTSFTGCGQKPVELFFLLDSSSSIWQVDFQKQLTFVNEVINQFDVSSVTTRVGVASFSHSYRKNIDLSETTNKHDLKAKVGVIRQMFGGTHTNVALDGIRRDLGQTKTRPGVARIAIVLTDGESFNQQKTEIAARKLKVCSMLKKTFSQSIYYFFHSKLDSKIQTI